jgi:hypothetical protein
MLFRDWPPMGSTRQNHAAELTLESLQILGNSLRVPLRFVEDNVTYNHYNDDLTFLGTGGIRAALISASFRATPLELLRQILATSPSSKVLVAETTLPL